MGPDIYLTGEKHFIVHPRRRGDLKSHRYALGSWRKHPNLHGYIVSNFAGGMDDRREIELSLGDLEQILSAVEHRQLPHGGVLLRHEQRKRADEGHPDLFRRPEMATASAESEYRSVCYQASW